jgi:hypothetical protein
MIKRCGCLVAWLRPCVSEGQNYSTFARCFSMSSSTVNGFLLFCDRGIRPSWCGDVLKWQIGQGRSLAWRFGLLTALVIRYNVGARIDETL